MDKPTVKAKPKSSRGIESCHAVEVGVENFAECSKQGPNPCSYALPFGYCFLCTNPRVDEIIENTKKARPFAGDVKN